MRVPPFDKRNFVQRGNGIQTVECGNDSRSCISIIAHRGNLRECFPSAEVGIVEEIDFGNDVVGFDVDLTGKSYF